jgi:2-dehydro-3-deoxygalactonokinase
VILAVDSGTTSTRAWVVSGGRVEGGARGPGGARDLARKKDKGWLLGQVRRVADEALEGAGEDWASVEAVVMFGMITSELGLEEIPHLPAPAGAPELAAGMVRRSYDDLPAPVRLVPGVRCGDDFRNADFMRGEETEVAGLLSVAGAEPPLLYVSPGSHTKFVSVDADGRISWSMTTLSGELLWALHQETILAKLVDPGKDIEDLSMVEEGARLVEEGGLGRALFAARLLNRIQGASAGACSDFVHGAVAMGDVASLRSALKEHEAASGRVALGGGGTLAGAYRHLLEKESWVDELQERREPLGALGSWSLYAAVTDGAPSEAYRNRE